VKVSIGRICNLAPGLDGSIVDLNKAIAFIPPNTFVRQSTMALILTSRATYFPTEVNSIERLPTTLSFHASDVQLSKPYGRCVLVIGDGPMLINPQKDSEAIAGSRFEILTIYSGRAAALAVRSARHARHGERSPIPRRRRFRGAIAGPGGHATTMPPWAQRGNS
jgi:hypothetical protein